MAQEDTDDRFDKLSDSHVLVGEGSGDTSNDLHPEEKKCNTTAGAINGLGRTFTRPRSSPVQGGASHVADIQ